MERYEEKMLGFYSKCSRCHKPMALGQMAYMRIVDDGTVGRIGPPICYECRMTADSRVRKK